MSLNTTIGLRVGVGGENLSDGAASAPEWSAFSTGSMETTLSMILFFSKYAALVSRHTLSVVFSRDPASRWDSVTTKRESVIKYELKAC